VVEEITYWREKYSVIDFAFYDDALLIDADRHIMPILEGVLRRSLAVRFHTPNALHIRHLSKEVAQMLFRCRFKTIRLGFETAFFEGRRNLDRKVDPDEFQQAVCHLKEAGFAQESVGAYLLFGLPGQDPGKVEASIRMVKACKGTSYTLGYLPCIYNTARTGCRTGTHNDYRIVLKNSQRFRKLNRFPPVKFKSMFEVDPQHRALWFSSISKLNRLLGFNITVGQLKAP